MLALLAQRPMHGYELMGELADRIGRHYRPSPGSIYPAVNALEAEGLVEAIEDGERRVYRLTPVGADALAKRTGRLARLESELGARFGEDSIDVVLARFSERVRSMSAVLDPASVEALLERTAETIESMASQEEQE